MAWEVMESVWDVMEPEWDCTTPAAAAAAVTESGNPLAVAIVLNPGRAVIT